MEASTSFVFCTYFVFMYDIVARIMYTRARGVGMFTWPVGPWYLDYRLPKTNIL